MVDSRTPPGFRKRLAFLRHRPESPGFFSGGLIECRDESAHALIASRDPGDHQVADNQTEPTSRYSSASNPPSPFPRGSAPVNRFKRDDMRVIHHHKQAISGRWPRRD